MNILLFGGTGFVGKRLNEFLLQHGHQVSVSDFRRDRDWPSKLKTADAIINLAGTPIFGKRWTSQYKSQIFDSRIEGTEKIFEELKALRAAEGDDLVNKKCFISASAIGYYGSRADETLTESSEPGSDFLSFTCQNWELEAKKVEGSVGVRTVILRFGIILGKEGGALKQMLPPFKMGVGGVIGNGKQWMSWVHLEDICQMILWAIQTKSARGAYNAVSPDPVRNHGFTKTLGKVLNRPTFFPIPKLGMYVLFGEAASILVGSQRCVPRRLLEEGFKFTVPDLESALRKSL